MAPDPLNSSSLEGLALKGLKVGIFLRHSVKPKSADDYVERPKKQIATSKIREAVASSSAAVHIVQVPHLFLIYVCALD